MESKREHRKKTDLHSLEEGRRIQAEGELHPYIMEHTSIVSIKKRRTDETREKRKDGTKKKKREEAESTSIGLLLGRIPKALL